MVLFNRSLMYPIYYISRRGIETEVTKEQFDSYEGKIKIRYTVIYIKYI